MLTLQVTPLMARLRSMAALAAAFVFRLIIRGPRPVFSWTAGLLSHTMLVMAKSNSATSELAFLISVMASCSMTGLFQTAVGALCATMTYVPWGTVAGVDEFHPIFGVD